MSATTSAPRLAYVCRLVLDNAFVHPSVRSCTVVASTRERLDSFTEAAQHDPLSVLFFGIDWRELVDVMDPGVLTLWTRCRIKHTSGERGERQSHSSISGPFGDESN